MVLLVAAYAGFDKKISGVSVVLTPHNEAVLGAHVPKPGRKGDPTRMI